ncbi:MAG: glycosyltransferase family 4 protein [Armatimonadetes bacterium]|nr:glycosyltransferase family 4 protein [Armatimonadota bacterium]
MRPSPLRVAIDCRTVAAPKTGDRTYALNLTRALARIDRETLYLLYTAEPTPYTRLEVPNVEPVVLPVDPPWIWTPFAFPEDLARAHASVAHVQYITPLRAPCPVITTIHDVAFRRFPRLFPLKHAVLLNTLIPIAVRRAARVLTGSEATRRDLLQFYHLAEERVVVTPYAADPIYRPMDRDLARARVAQAFGIKRPYVLSVGVLQPRKNLPRLVRAFACLAREFPHQLVLVGKEGWASAELRRAVAETRLEARVTFTGYVADPDLPALYAAADLFAYPSLYEGFGLPPLEAMACGTPVVTSNVSSLPEVTGDAARWVDPHSVAEIAAALRDLLEDKAERQRLSAAGLVRARRFSWDETARRTLAVYREVAG